MTSPQQLIRSTNSTNDVVLGHTEPRIWTPPLVELTEETSYGYDVIWFAEHVVGLPLDDWEQWCVIHGGELLPDGRPRFRYLLILVARQNGKTTLAMILVLFWLFVEKHRMILGTSTNRNYAMEAWKNTVELTMDNPVLAKRVPRYGVRTMTGSEEMKTIYGSRYKFSASNGRTGRSLTINRLLLDELREHKKWDAWNAATNAMNAVPDAQCLAISNQGEMDSVVLDSFYNSALTFIQKGEGDYRYGLFEYSAPEGSDPDDVHALAYANPNLGRRLHPDDLIGQAQKAMLKGGEELAGFKTEVMCQRVHKLNPAIELLRWHDGATEHPLDLADYRHLLAVCVDISLDGSHATLMGAALIDSKVNVEVLKAWNGFGCSKAVRADLPDVVRKIRPRVLCWFPNGPTASIAAELKAQKGPRRSDWPPRGVMLQELTSETSTVCMGLAEQVIAGDIVHPGDDFLDAQVRNAEKIVRGSTWVLGRTPTSPVDAVYALAGATHMARRLPPPRQALEIA